MNKGYIYAVIAALIWSSMGIFVRFISLSGFVVYFFAALISSVIFGILLINEKRLLDIFMKKEVWIVAIFGFSGVINNVTYFQAYNLTTIANATFVHYLAPIFVAVLSPMILLEKTDKRMWLALTIAIAGLFVLVKPTTFVLNDRNGIGILMAFISAIAYAFGIMLGRKSTKHFEPKQILFVQTFLSVLILAPFVINLKPSINSNDIIPLIILGAIHQGLAIILSLKALAIIPAQKVSTIAYLEPVGATLLATFFLAEIPSLFTLIGGGLILMACYLTIRN